MMVQSLTGLYVLNLSTNLPGPLAARRLQELGAEVIKVEPPVGDPLARYLPTWYHELSKDQRVVSLDLKTVSGRSKLDELLAQSDLLLTALRPAALQRLELSWEILKSRFRNICHVSILGYPPPYENRPGHDLNYQAKLGLLSPPMLPRALLADFAGAEQAVSAALSLLYARERGMGTGYAEVFLSDAAKTFAQPLQYKITQKGGMLGGGFAPYNLYQTLDGWIAIAALEPHFWERLKIALGFDEADPGYEDLARIIAMQTSKYWEEWADRFDLPLVAVSK